MSKTVYAVSTTYWNDEEPGGGGFFWFHTEAAARDFFAKERQDWADTAAYIRLVPVEVPTELTDDEVTDELDAHIEWLEYAIDKDGDKQVTLPALAVALTTAA